MQRGPELLRCSATPAWWTRAATGSIVFAGIVAALRARTRPSSRTTRAAREPPPARLVEPSATAPTSPSPATASTPGRYARELEELGDSVLVVGDRMTLKVHVHTDEPEHATPPYSTGSVGGATWTSPTCTSRRSSAAPGWRTGAGERRPLRRGRGRLGRGHAAAVRRAWRLGARGGPTLNPSTYDLLAGIHAVAGRGGRRSAQQRERVHGRRARGRAVREGGRRRPTRSPQAGLAAPVALDPDAARPRTPRADEALTGRAPAGSRPPRATTPRAASTWRRGRLRRRGDRRLGRRRPTPQTMLEQLAEDAEILTCIAGDGAPTRPRRSTPSLPTGRGRDAPRAVSRAGGGLISAE